MNGHIAQLIGSAVPADVLTVSDVFGPKFRTMGGWRSFLRAQLQDDVTSQLAAPAPRWSAKSFQALYIACWIHHPVEKGSFMIDLASISTAQRDVIGSAHQKHCTARKSSHLGGSGRSASKGWAFLNGYHELLVQYESTKGHPYLFLKAEGHTTGASGIVPHLQSWAHKRKHGVGLEASPALNALATANPLVESRAAENYARGYGKLLKSVLGLGGRQVTVREAVQVLFQETGYPAPQNFHMVMSNQLVGTLLAQYCDAATTVGAGGVNYRLGGRITGEMIADLRTVAQTLRSDGDVHMVRVYREIRVKPAAVDQSLAYFYGSPG